MTFRAPWLAALLLWATTLVAGAARADVEDEPVLPERLHPVAVSLGGQAALLFGDRCRRMLTDVVGCTSGLGYAGAHLATRLRVDPSWSFGLRGSGSSSGSATTFWQASALARWHPFGAVYPDVWIGPDAGIVAIVEHLDADELGPEASFTQVAPILGLEAGVDFPVTPILTVGPSLRGFVIPMGGLDYMPSRGTNYSTQLGVELGLALTLLLGS
jgi:hypothetical protein